MVAIIIAAWAAFATGTAGRIVTAAALADPLSVFAERSPGIRPPGALTQTKPRRALPLNFAKIPTERVLSAIRSRPPEIADVGPAGGPVVIPEPEVPAITPTGIAIPLPAEEDSFVGRPSTPFIPAPGGIFNGTPVADTGGTPPGGGVVTPPSVAVPEPATWIAMLFGIAAIGATMRTRRFKPRVVVGESSD